MKKNKPAAPQIDIVYVHSFGFLEGGAHTHASSNLGWVLHMQWASLQVATSLTHRDKPAGTLYLVIHALYEDPEQPDVDELTDLRVLVHSACDLLIANVSGRRDPYVTLTIGEQSVCAVQVVLGLWAAACWCVYVGVFKGCFGAMAATVTNVANAEGFRFQVWPWPKSGNDQVTRPFSWHQN